jgi:predicted GIY-YIG superfamily endonuclease
MPKPTSRKIKPDHFDRKRRKQREKTHILYRCYDRATTLLYVGMTNDPENRFRHHQQVQPWWHQVDHIRLQNLPNREALSRAETAAIQLEQPVYNIVNADTRHQAQSRQRLGNGKGKGGFQLWPEANRFGTRQPSEGHLIEMTVEQVLYPCANCKVRGIHCEGNIVACRMCGAQWSYDRWFAETFLNMDEFGQLRLM